MILSREAPITNTWWGELESGFSDPWVGKDDTVTGYFVAGKDFDSVTKTSLVKKLIEIYALIYHAREFEKRSRIRVYPVTRKLLKGDYDPQFRTAPKGYTSKWDWVP